MFSTRPDAQSFTKFLVTAGVFLIVAAFIVPGLILRETDVLKVPIVALNHATPVGRKELERRQRVARDVGESTPWIFGGLLLSGGVLLFYGAPRLRKQEAEQETRAQVELDKLRSEIKQQTPEEREQKLQDDVAVEIIEEQLQAALPDPASPDRPQRSAQPATNEPRTPSEMMTTQDRVRRAGELEERVLDRIGSLVPQGFEFVRHVRVGGEPPLLLDGLMSDRTGERDAVLIEVQAPLSSTAGMRKRLLDVEAARLRYADRIGGDPALWLVVITNPAVMTKSQALAPLPYLPWLFLSVSTESEIDDLKLPSSLETHMSFSSAARARLMASLRAIP
ncbi:MAG: hypothetical protein QOD71_3186 [Thermoleophilaceae bacterium]|jgi:hypothetical protein|nr:hypothetical protein [Thermoleophilaceae bacterium]